MWFIFALLSAVFTAARRTNEKQLAHKLNHFTIGWALKLSALPVLVAATFLSNSWLNPLSTYLYIKALKGSEQSLLSPLLGLSPIMALG